MKRMTSRNGLIVSVLVLTWSLSAVIWATSCQKQSFEDELSLPQRAQNKTTEELPYLDFTTEFNGIINSPSDSNALILTEAINRVKYLQNDGWWNIDAVSAQDVNMSESLFEYIQGIAERNNSRLAEILQQSMAPRIRKPEIADSPYRNDCVAQCMGYLSGFLGYANVTTAAVNAYVTATFGAGIPHDKLLPTMQYFYGRNNVSMISSGALNQVDLSQAGVMMTHLTGADSGHAVVYISTAKDGSYNVYDPQNNCIDNIASNQVIGIYQVLKNH